jgi:uroporphyrinogen decarboxylase
MARYDRFLNACRREPVDRTPIWIMRQAGRYMAEYRHIREKHSFMEMCKTPDLAVEVTLQPVRRFDLDAAIIFSDILLPLEKMGAALRFNDAKGPIIEKPVRSKEDVKKLKVLDVEEDLSYVLQAIEEVREELDGAVPLIGFSGAPFTLASYLIEGGGSKQYESAKALMYTETAVFRLLMDKLTDMAVEYLNAQTRHGAQAVQVFDSWVGILSTRDYREYVLPHMKRLFASLDRSVPSIHFGVGTYHLLSSMREAGGDVIGVDWRVPIDEAWTLLGRDNVAIQGNLDPAALFGTPDSIRTQVQDIIGRTRGLDGHIFNLGHGILPGTPVENVEFLVECVHSESGSRS